MSDSLLYARDGAIVTLTLNRPEQLNTLDQPMVEGLIGHTAAIAADPSVRCVVLTGAGKHFMAGGDIRGFATTLSMPGAERQATFERFIGRVHIVLETMHRMPQPIIARVQGAVAGIGLSLMCACDLAIAADSAYFNSAYRHIGVSPDGGSTYLLPRIVGVRKAMEIVLLGERFDAAEALRLGLVNRVVPLTDLDAATASMAKTVASGAAMSNAGGKRLVNQSFAHSISQQLHAEMMAFAACAGTDDFVEGVNAFVAKRPPQFGKGA